MINLGAVEGDACSAAMAINSKEQIVGGSDDCTGNNANAFPWEKGSIINLNAFVSPDSGVQLTIGLSVNERGQIAAQGVLANGDMHACVLIPCGKGNKAPPSAVTSLELLISTSTNRANLKQHGLKCSNSDSE